MCYGCAAPKDEFVLSFFEEKQKQNIIRHCNNKNAFEMGPVILLIQKKIIKMRYFLQYGLLILEHSPMFHQYTIQW